MKYWQKNFLTLILAAAIVIVGLPGSGQDIPPNEDLSLGSSVFVFRAKTPQKKFVAKSSARIQRTRTQRVASTTKIHNQYDNLEKTKTRRAVVKTVSPDVVAKKTPTEKPEVTSAKFTGVGQYYYAQNNFDKAVEFFNAAINLNAKNQNAKLGLSDALAAKGAALFAADKKDEAKQNYEDAIKYNDKNSAAYAGLGELYDSLDKTSETSLAAIKNFEKALGLDKDLTEVYAPLGVLYFQQNDLAKADEYLTKAVANDAEDATTQYFLGQVRYKQEHYQDAATALDKSIKLNKAAGSETESAEAHFYLGESYDKLNRPDEAVVEYKEATRINPKYADAWFDLGVYYYNRGDYEEARVAYTQAVTLDNANGQAHANMADTYRQLKNYEAANGEYTLADAFIKDDAELYSNWGFCLGKVEKWSNAITRLNEATTLSPDAIDYTNLGWAYYNSAQADLKPPAGRAKNEAEAKTNLQAGKVALQNATKLNPNLAPAFLNLGITLNDLTEYQAAKEALLRATSLRKNWLFAINELGLSYRQLKDYPNAIEQFRRTTEINDKYDIGYYNLGEAELRSGNIKEAKKALEKLKKLNKNLGNNLEVLILGLDASPIPGKNKIKSILKLPY
ncbi:MAG: tetratricopeptide repeat protein [Acidobacteriota bacterium]|nr:tetratricopeptide repeat protein [Acidobacteriota bacterium]